MKKLIRVALFAVVASFLFSAPNAFAIDSCLLCKGIVGDGSVYMFCDRVSGGELGARYCFIEYDGYSSYCHTEGDWCCATGPMY
jgi:hypothetical protein